MERGEGPNYAGDLTFSPDGALLLVTGVGQMALYEASTGQRRWLRRAEDPKQGFGRAAFADADTLAVNAPGGVELIDVGTGQPTRRIDHVGALAFSPGGAVLASAGTRQDWTVRLWNPDNGLEFRALATFQKVLGGFVGNVGTRHYVDCSQRTPHLVSASRIEGVTRIWDLSQVGPPFEAATPGVNDVLIHPGRDEVLVAFKGGVAVFDLRRGTRLRTFPVGPTSRLAFDARGALLAVGNHQGAVAVLDYAAGTVLLTRQLVQGPITGLTLGGGGRSLTAASTGGMAAMDLLSGQVQPVRLQFVNDLAISPVDGQTTMAIGPAKWVTGANPTQSNPEANFKIVVFKPGGDFKELLGHQQAPQSIAYSADGRTLASASSDGTVRLWDPAAGTPIATLEGHRSDVDNVAFCQGGRLASSSADGTVKLWDLAGRDLEVTLVAIGEGNYVIATPDNYYTASRDGLDTIAFRLGSRVVPFSQFDLRLNRPDKVLEGLGQSTGALIEGYRQAWVRRVRKMGFTPQQLEAGLALPEVRLDAREIPTHTDARQLSLNVEAWDDNADLDRVNVYVNGVPVLGRAGRPVDGDAFSGAIPLTLASGRNRIEVSAHNARGVESLRDTVEVVYQGPADPPTLYLLTVGVSTYDNPDLYLEYAAKDADDLVALYRDHPDAHGFADVVVRQVHDKDATREGILAARGFLEQASVDDQVVVFMAGHGTLDADQDYWFGTTDVDIDDPAARGLSWQAIEGLLDGLEARRRLLLIDTCHSGEVDVDEAPPRTVAEGQVVSRGFTRKKSGPATAGAAPSATELQLIQGEVFADLRRGAGATVISSASGLEFALESARWNNGVFTYALIDGMSSARADLDGNGAVAVSELRDHVAEVVPALTGGQQNPTFRRENLEDDFVLYGQPPPTPAAAEPLLRAAPVVIGGASTSTSTPSSSTGGGGGDGGALIAFKPHVGFLLTGTGLSTSTCTADDGVPCPDDETVATRDASSLALGADLMFALGRYVGLGLGTRYVLESAVTAEDTEVLGSDLALEGVLELSLPVLGWLDVNLRGGAGLLTLFPSGDLQEGIDALEERCDGLEGGSIRCGVQSGPFYGLSASGGVALDLRWGLLHLRPELIYQYIQLDLHGLNARGEDSIETQVDYTGDRLWLVLGVQIGG